MLGLNLNDQQAKIVGQAIADYRGNVVRLESAVGALVVGSNYGWRLLKIVHSSSTYKDYESVLGVRFQDVCPERTALSKKSYALSIADKLKSFWSVATGKKSVKEKMLLGNVEEVDRAVALMEGKPYADG